MSTTTLKILTYPKLEAGLTLVTPPVAWSYTDWFPLAKIISTPIYIFAIRFQIATILTADTTYQELFEIGINEGAGIVTKLQIPYSDRNDTAACFYPSQNDIFLPEPYAVNALASIYIRAAADAAAAITFNGIKILYQASVENNSELRGGVPNNYQFVEAGNGTWTGERIR